ncbi:hypothetical protein GCM10018980_39110 [Streptomyces capoamus]|uniref:Uncharacterized protein n=1 Tax=Streptomyces capoamus TaxID=68183 RepID=A0A919C7X1_9ACTN|nr:hypothetical protein GCM10018980_39110 [Streptomyces capoamus]
MDPSVEPDSPEVSDFSVEPDASPVPLSPPEPPTPVSTSTEPEPEVSPDSRAQVAQGAVPLWARIFSATAICWLRLAWSGLAAYWPPP